MNIIPHSIRAGIEGIREGDYFNKYYNKTVPVSEIQIELEFKPASLTNLLLTRLTHYLPEV